MTELAITFHIRAADPETVKTIAEELSTAMNVLLGVGVLDYGDAGVQYEVKVENN